MKGDEITENALKDMLNIAVEHINPDPNALERIREKVAKGKPAEAKFKDQFGGREWEKSEPEWITDGRAFAEKMARIKLAESQTEVEIALRNYNIERKYNG